MAKSKEKKKLPKADTIPTSKPFLDLIKERKEKVAKAKATATKDGKFNKYEPKFRIAQKRLKRAQRKLTKEIIRQVPHLKKVEVAAPAAAAAPVEAKKE